MRNIIWKNSTVESYIIHVILAQSSYITHNRTNSIKQRHTRKILDVNILKTDESQTQYINIYYGKKDKITALNRSSTKATGAGSRFTRVQSHPSKFENNLHFLWKQSPAFKSCRRSIVLTVLVLSKLNK